MSSATVAHPIMMATAMPSATGSNGGTPSISAAEKPHDHHRAERTAGQTGRHPTGALSQHQPRDRARARTERHANAELPLPRGRHAGEHRRRRRPKRGAAPGRRTRSSASPGAAGRRALRRPPRSSVIASWSGSERSSAASFSLESDLTRASGSPRVRRRTDTRCVDSWRCDRYDHRFGVGPREIVAHVADDADDRHQIAVETNAGTERPRRRASSGAPCSR